MFAQFTPYKIIRERQKQFVALLLVLAILLSSGWYLFLYNLADASTTYTWSGDGLALGTNASTTSAVREVSLYREEVTEAGADFYNGAVAEKADETFTEVTDEGVRLSHWTEIDAASMPGLSTGYIASLFLSGDLLYVGDNSDVPKGVGVIDTNSTNDPADDDFLYSYTSTSTPALVSNSIENIYRYGDLLYVSTSNAGVSVIDTKGTVTISDDTLAGTYRTNTTPAIVNNTVYSVIRLGDSLYIQTRVASLRTTVTLIDTKGTTITSDDTVLTNYTNINYSEPKILDGLLYLSNRNGQLQVIDFAGTATTTDDVLLGSYSSTTSPSITDLGIVTKNGNYLYVATFDGWVNTIDTKGTSVISDDEVVGQHNYDSYLYNFYVDGDYQILNYQNRLLFIDTKGTSVISDDEANEYISPLGRGLGFLTKIGEGFVFGGEYDKGPIFFNKSEYVNDAMYYGQPQQIGTIPKTLVSATTTNTSSEATMKYRTGNELAAWHDDMDDAASYVGDFYEWGYGFESAVVEDGVLKLSGFGNNYSNGVYNNSVDWFDVASSAASLPLGTIVKMRVRLVSDTAENAYLILITDDEWDYSLNTLHINEWKTLQLTNAWLADFEHVGIEAGAVDGTLAVTDRFEIDWIEVIPPDSAGYWNEWQTCDSLDSCPIDPTQLAGNEWIQYAVTLSTDDVSTTPTLASVTYAGPYEATGIYTSQAETFTEPQELLTFTTVDTVPASTSINYEYSIDGGLNWTGIRSGDSFPRGTTASSFVWRATLSSESDLVTPVISSVSLTATDVSSSEVSSTRIQSRIEKLEQNGLSEEAAYLRKTFPDVFDENGEATTAEIQQGILSRIEKVLDLMEKLLAAKAKENNQ